MLPVVIVYVIYTGHTMFILGGSILKHSSTY